MQQMARAISVDTLQYAKKLREAGASEQTAEIQAEALKEVIENNLATKHDILELRRDVDVHILELRKDIDVLNKDLTIRLGGMIAIAVSVLSVLITLLNRFH